MSVTIHWRPTTDKGKHFDGGTSSSLENLKRAIGTVIDTKHIPQLQAMYVATNDPFYDEVANIVARVGEIEVWGEW